MKKKMNLATEIDLTQDSVVQLTCWCGQIALHELWGLGGKGQTGETLISSPMGSRSSVSG